VSLCSNTYIVDLIGITLLCDCWFRWNIPVGSWSFKF